MKRILRHYLVNTLALYIASVAISGLVFEKGFETVFTAGAGLTAISIFVRPIINLLLLPINLVTFGLFRWVTSTIALYLVTLVIPGFSIAGFAFAGFVSKWFDLPAIDVSSVLAFVAFSFVISLISSLMYWLIK